MPVPPSSRIAACLVDLVDPRMARTGGHDLLDIVSSHFARSSPARRVGWRLRSGAPSTWGSYVRGCRFPNDIPSHDTFGRLFSCVVPAQRERGFLRCVQVLAAAANTTGGVVAIDGKFMRAAREHQGSRDASLKPGSQYTKSFSGTTAYASSKRQFAVGSPRQTERCPGALMAR
jgi:hypothetical protein